GGAPLTFYALGDPRAYLVDGTNVLAVHALNNQPNSSSDFGFNAQLYAYIADPTIIPPRVTSITPAAGDVFYLTNLIIKFTEGVSGVDASDLRINGTPANSVSSTTNTTYSFNFAQPAYGQVYVTWASTNGIRDFDSPPKPFDGAAPGSTFQFSLINPNAPIVASQLPLAGAAIFNLTQLTVTFSKSVTGVDASDLLVSGFPATNVTGSGSTYTFTFPEPSPGLVSIGWSANAGIQDTAAPPNPFDGLRPVNLWS